MNRIINKILHYCRWLDERAGYFRTKILGIRAPVFPLILLPDGFKIRQVGDTGISIVENFLTRDEALYLIEQAAQRLSDSLITIGNKRVKDSYRTSQTAVVLDPYHLDSKVVTLVRRAAMLLSLPASHAESVYVTRYRGGEYYKAHHDAFPGFDGDRLYTVLIYLNDLTETEGGGTVFEKLNVGVYPKCGRAVIWTNKNPDGQVRPETLHEALPVAPEATKWVIQLWFRRYPMLAISDCDSVNPQSQRGTALGNDPLPLPGIVAPGVVAPDSDYQEAFRYTDS